MRHQFSIVVTLMLVAMLAGCAKPKVEMGVASQPNVNPDHSGRPSPVIMKMYELTSDMAFKQGDFIALFENPVQTLGQDLVAADELVFVPGEARTVVYQPNERTKFVGILLGFRQMERANWRVIKPVNAEEDNRIFIELIDTSVLLIDDQAASDWDPVEAVRNFQKRLGQPPVVAQTPAGTGVGAPGAPVAPVPGAPNAAGTPGQYVLPAAKRM